MQLQISQSKIHRQLNGMEDCMSLRACSVGPMFSGRKRCMETFCCVQGYPCRLQVSMHAFAGRGGHTRVATERMRLQRQAFSSMVALACSRFPCAILPVVIARLCNTERNWCESL